MDHLWLVLGGSFLSEDIYSFSTLGNLPLMLLYLSLLRLLCWFVKDRHRPWTSVVIPYITLVSPISISSCFWYTF